MTTPLFMLRCLEVGISVAELELLSIGLVLDIWTEKRNDSATYPTCARMAGQADFDRF